MPLWIGLGLLLLLRGTRSTMPGWAAIAAPFAYPLAACAAWVGAENCYDAPGGWSILAPALLPPLIAGYALWLRIPALRPVLQPDIASALGLGAIGLAVVAVPLLAWIDQLQAPARLARYERQQEELGARHQAELAKLEAEIAAQRRALNPDSPLKDHLEYVNWTSPGTPEHDKALAGARQAKSRQEDAIKLLGAGRIAWLEEMPLLDIEPTPALCAAFDDAFRRQAADPEQFDTNVAQNLRSQLPNLRFLIGANCKPDSVLDAAAARVQKILDTIGPQDGARPEWTAFRDTLTALRQAH